MSQLKDYNYDELVRFHEEVTADYKNACSKGLKLDMSRGKPGEEQLALSKDMLLLPVWDEACTGGGDARNYGILSGLPKCREFFAELLGVEAGQVFVGGNASLSLMYDLIAKAYTNGLLHSEKPWARLDKVKFLCPAPGYDRHFTICESFGMEMITVAMTDQGPDMDQVEELVKDPEVKGMWCVPKYSNPDGIIYSDEVIDRIAKLKPAAPDFVVMWDNAYIVHEFEGDYVEFPDILKLCKAAGNEDMVVEFASTSKITLPGAGVSCFACSEANMKYLTKLLTAQAISYDKMNQLRHLLFLKDKKNVIALMKKHGAILKPRFDMVISKLDKEVEPLGIAKYFKPKGGYFVSVYAKPGTAKRIYSLMEGAGVVMTKAGATYPYGIDPEDSNLRVAPSFVSLDELSQAMDVFCTCIKLAAVEKELEAYGEKRS